jgi:hypothetical protein
MFIAAVELGILAKKDDDDQISSVCIILNYTVSISIN